MPRPLASTDRVLVVGAGHAGVQLADCLRADGFTGPLTLLGQEDVLPYQRPPVSKEHLKAGGCAAVPLRGERFFPEAGIDLLAGRRVVDIDRAARAVRTADGTVLGYDHLVLATGSRPRDLDLSGWPDVPTLHTPADAERLRRLLDGAASLLVIGAGFIGLEVAAAAAARGIGTTVVAADGRAMARSVTEEASTHAAAAHAAAGTTFRWGRAIEGLVLDGDRIAGVTLDGGDVLRADLVVAGVGAVPNDELAAAAGLPTAAGVLVDATLATPDPRVSAVGDCARFTSGGGALRLESVQNAGGHARHLARRLLTGSDDPYLEVPWFWSTQGALRLTIAGLPSAHLETVRRGDVTTGAFSLYGFHGDRLVSVESFNRAGDHLAARRLLAGGPLPTRAQVADPEVDLRALSRAGSEGRPQDPRSDS